MSERLKFLGNDPQFLFYTPEHKTRILSEQVPEFNALPLRAQESLVSSLEQRRPELDVTTGMGALGRARLSFAETDDDVLTTLQNDLGKENAVQTPRGIAYREKPEDAWKLVDEEGISYKDLADWVGSAPEYVGGTVGGVLGAGAGLGVGSVGGAMAGGAIGGAGGEAVQKVIGGILGVEQPTIGDSIQDVVEAGAFGAASELGGKYIAKGLNKITSSIGASPNKRITNATMGMKEMFPHFNAHLTPAVVYESGTIDLLEGLSTTGLIGGGKIGEVALRSLEKVSGMGSKFGALFARNMETRNVSTSEMGEMFGHLLSAPEGKGKIIKGFGPREGLPRWRPSTYQHAVSERTIIKNVAKKKGITINIERMLRNEKFGEDFQKMMKTAKIEPITDKAGAKALSVEDGFTMKRLLSQHSRDADYDVRYGNQSRSVAKEANDFKQSYKRTYENSLNEIGIFKDKNGKKVRLNIRDEVRKNDEAWIKHYDLYDAMFTRNIIASSVKQGKPEGVLSQLVGPEGVTRIRAFKRQMMGDSHFDPDKFAIQPKNLPWAKSTRKDPLTGRTVIDPRAQKMATMTYKSGQILALQGMIRKAGTKQAMGTFHFPSGQGILKQLDKFGQDAAHDFFGPKMTTGIRNYGKMLAEMQAEKGAQAGSVGLRLLQFTQGLSLMAAIASGGTIPLSAISVLGLPYLLASGLANETVAGLLKKGMLAPLTQKGTSQAIAAFSRVGKILVESQKEQIRFVKDSMYADMDIPDEDIIFTEVPVHQPPEIQMPVPGTGPPSPAITPPRGNFLEDEQRGLEDFLRQREIRQQERFPQLSR